MYPGGKLNGCRVSSIPAGPPLAGRALCSFRAKEVGETQVRREEGIPITHWVILGKSLFFLYRRFLFNKNERPDFMVCIHE